MKNIHKINENIYITSDEEIKEGDYYITPNDTVLKALGPMLINVEDYKKIILTTDFRLASDVQKIDDEFLEWFVKNPSCESVDVEHAPDGVFYYKDKDDIPYGCYKILIPKEEPKHLGQITEKGIIDIIGNCANCGVEFHIHKDIPKPTQQIIDKDFNGGLTMGQIIPKEETICIQTGLPCGITCFSEEVCNRNFYTEEDVKNAFLDGWQLRDGDLPFPKAKKKWFEQFKNK